MSNNNEAPPTFDSVIKKKPKNQQKNTHNNPPTDSTSPPPTTTTTTTTTTTPPSSQTPPPTTTTTSTTPLPPSKPIPSSNITNTTTKNNFNNNNNPPDFFSILPPTTTTSTTSTLPPPTTTTTTTSSPPPTTSTTTSTTSTTSTTIPKKDFPSYQSPPSFDFDSNPTTTTTTTTTTTNFPPPTTTTTTSTPSTPSTTTSTTNLYLPPSMSTTTTTSTTPFQSSLLAGSSYYNNTDNSNQYTTLSSSSSSISPQESFFPTDDPFSELPSYSAPAVANFQLDVQYASTVHFSTFFRSSAPTAPLHVQNLINQYPLSEYHYSSPDDLLIVPHKSNSNSSRSNNDNNNNNNNNNTNINNNSSYIPPTLPQQPIDDNVITVDHSFFDSSSDDDNDDDTTKIKSTKIKPPTKLPNETTTEPQQRNTTIVIPQQQIQSQPQPQPQQQQQQAPRIPIRQDKYPFRETIPESFSPTLYYPTLYTSYKYCWGPITLTLIPLTIASFVFAGFLLQPALAIMGGVFALLLLLSSMSIYHLWSLPYSAWKNHGPEHFLAFPGSSVQHALPFDPILCGLFCCRSRSNNNNNNNSDPLSNNNNNNNDQNNNFTKSRNRFKNKNNKNHIDNSLQHEQKVAIARRTTPVNCSLQQLAQKIDKMDRCKPVLMFAVTCYRDYNSFHLVNRYHSEGRQLKEISKANISPFRCHLYYIEIDSFSNVSCPAEEITAIANHSSQYIDNNPNANQNGIPQYLRQHYSSRPLRAAYIEFHATYALNPEDYAWVNEARDKLAEVHTNEVFQYVDVDVLYCLDGLSSATSDFHFYRDLEGLSVIPLDISPDGLNHFSKYNTDGANNPRGLSSFGTAGDLLRDFDYELTFAGTAPINTFLPIPLQTINQQRLRAEEERLTQESLLREKKLLQNKSNQNIGLFNQINFNNTSNNHSNDTLSLSNLDSLATTTTPTDGENNNNSNNNDNIKSIKTADEAMQIISNRPNITPEEQVEIIHSFKQSLLISNPTYDHESIQTHPEFQKFLRLTIGDSILDQHGQVISQDDNDHNLNNNNNNSNNNNNNSTQDDDSKNNSPQNYETIFRLILPDLYRTSCKLPFAVQTHGFHYTQIIFNTITFILFLGLGLLPCMSLLWRNTWCCAPRKYAFYHKKMIKLKRTYILPDSNEYLTR